MLSPYSWHESCYPLLQAYLDAWNDLKLAPYACNKNKTASWRLQAHVAWTAFSMQATFANLHLEIPPRVAIITEMWPVKSVPITMYVVSNPGKCPGKSQRLVEIIMRRDLRHPNRYVSPLHKWIAEGPMDWKDDVRMHFNNANQQTPTR